MDFYDVLNVLRNLEVVACVASVSVRLNVGAKNEERESKTDRKMAQVKDREGGGEERKETLGDKPRDFENHPLGLSCLSSRTDI